MKENVKWLVDCCLEIPVREKDNDEKSSRYMILSNPFSFRYDLILCTSRNKTLGSLSNVKFLIDKRAWADWNWLRNKNTW